MRGRIALLLWLAIAPSAHAQVSPDLLPVRCAWASFTPEQQTRLRNAFSVDNSGPNRLLRYVAPSAEETRAAAQACALNYTASQLKELAGALGYKAAEEVARMGIAARGLLKPEIVDRALTRLSDERRQSIGDHLACPGGGMIKYHWDLSVSSAMRRAGIRIVDGRTVALVALAIYSLVAQEGHIRRINGTAPQCREEN